MSANTPISHANVRSQLYYVAHAAVPCPSCGHPTRVLALAMPPAHETLDVDIEDFDIGAESDAGDRGGADSWQRADANAFLFYVLRLPDDVRHRMQQLSPNYRLAQSAAHPSLHWANHCERCGGRLDDHDLHCEPDGGFMPSSPAAAADIHLLQILEPFLAEAAGYAVEPEFFGFMRRS
jgi:hypothetical protein